MVANVLSSSEDAPTARQAPLAALVEGLDEGRIDRLTYDSGAQTVRWIDGEPKYTYLLGTPQVLEFARDAGAAITVERSERRVLDPLAALTLALGLLVYAVVPVAVGLDLVYRSFTNRASGRSLLWAAFVLIVPVVGAATYLGLRRETLGRASGVVAVAGALIAVGLA